MQVTTVGLDLAKRIFQVHGVNAAGKVVIRRRLQRSEIAAFFADLPACLVGMTPPSELIRPPSKAAVIFLRWTTGKQNGRRLSSVMAGVACLDPGKGLASATESYARSKAYATSVTANPPRHEYDGLGSIVW